MADLKPQHVDANVSSLAILQTDKAVQEDLKSLEDLYRDHILLGLLDESANPA